MQVTQSEQIESTPLKTRESRLEKLRSALSDLEGHSRIGRLDQLRLRQTLEQRTRDWQGLAGRHVLQTRQVLGTVLDGRIAFTPRLAGEEARYEFAGQTSLARVPLRSVRRSLLTSARDGS